MNPKYPVAAALLVFLSSVCFGQVEFTGYLAIGGDDSRFVLKESAEGENSQWIKLGSTFAGFKLLSFDPEKELLIVERSGDRLALSLKQSRIQSAAAPQPRLAKFKLGTLKITFASPSPISEQAVQEIMQLRPDTEFDDISLDRSIRALSRTAHIKSISVKQQQAAPGTLNLEVTVTPNSP